MTIVLFLLSLAIVSAVASALRADDLSSRVVAVDVAVVAFIGMLAADAVGRGNATFLDALPVLGLLAVLATLAAAWVQRAEPQGPGEEPIIRGGS